MEIKLIVKPESKEEGYYLSDAAKLLGCSEAHIRNKIRQGIISRDLFNGKIFISRKALAILEQS